MADLDEFSNGPFINKKKEKEVAEKFVKSLATKTPSVDQLVVNLSGGNQQKVVIAKWLTRNCDILIFDEPTRGIDVGAKKRNLQADEPACGRRQSHYNGFLRNDRDLTYERQDRRYV